MTADFAAVSPRGTAAQKRLWRRVAHALHWQGSMTAHQLRDGGESQHDGRTSRAR